MYNSNECRLSVEVLLASSSQRGPAPRAEGEVRPPGGALEAVFFQAEDGIRDFCLSRGLGDVYKRQE